MKKGFLYTAVTVAQFIAISMFAQDNKSNLDFEFRDVYRNYIEQKNLSNLSAKLTIGDTLELKSSYCIVEYVIPDTIWKKRVKKPKEYKHYFLQYKWNGVPTSEKAKNGFYVYKQSTYVVDGKYIYLGYDDTDIYNGWIIVKDPSSSRDIKVATKNIYVKSPKISREILTRMTSDTIFYTSGYGSREDDYHLLTIINIDYEMHIINSGCSGTITIKADKDGVKFNNGKLEIRNGKIISSSEYHKFWDKINRDKQFLSLVVIKDGIPIGMEYMFHSDTMALYRMEKTKEESWSDEENVYYCYAYGKSYKFGGKYYSRDCVEMLSPEDSTYLLSQKYNGEKYRLESAKRWDEKNLWLYERDEQWDKDTCIVAKLKWKCRLIDEYGEFKYDYSVDIPAENTEVPVICYGHDGDYLAAYRIYFRGEFFVIDWRGLEFKSEDENEYFMRRGQQGYSERLKSAFAYDLGKAVAEELDKKTNYNKKQIFFTECEAYDSGYGYEGIRLGFYNCFKKTIKYIDCTITPYNYFGEVQSDVIGRKSQSVRCIGPIEGVDVLWGENGKFEFDDVFCNRNGVIKDYKVTKIIITFVDNTTATYSEWNKIKPHSDL